MKIAVASEGKNENSQVCPTAGRAPYYLIFEDKKLIKTIKNPFAVGGGGAGFGVAKMLENEKVDLVISGKFGGNMQNALKSAGIKFKEVTVKKVKEIIKKSK
jgi:predicted Fe-Mo cluster-binding NifX family protein